MALIANFYTRYSHEAQSAYSVLLSRSLDTFQCRTYSAQFPLPREHSLPGIAAYNGTGIFKYNNLSPPTRSPFIHLGREQQCAGMKIKVKKTNRKKLYNEGEGRVILNVGVQNHAIWCILW